MSNTTKITGNFLQIKGLDADWSVVGDMDASFDKTGIKVKSITFHPSATGDAMIIKEADPGLVSTAGVIATTLTAPVLFQVICADVYDQRVKYFGNGGKWMRPFIDISDCVFTTAATCRVEMELA